MDEDNQKDSQDIAKKHRLQMDFIIKQGEYKRNESKRNELEIVIRQSKRKLELLNIDIHQSEDAIKKIDAEQTALDVEIKKLKKEISSM